MPTRYNSAGRIQPIETRNLAVPAECLLCKRIGHNPDEIFADLKVELGFYGDCYLCQDCCHEVAAFVLAVPFETYQRVMDEKLVLVTHKIGLEKQVNYLRSLLDARIDSAGSSVLDSDGAVSVPLFEVEPDATDVNSIINRYQSVPPESSSIHRR